MKQLENNNTFHAPNLADMRYYTSCLKALKKELAKVEPIEVKTLPTCERSLWHSYKRKVWTITEKQPLKRLPNFDKRGFKGYHLDHKVSIWYGYKHKLDPKLIGGIDNLEFIPHYENELKGIKCNFKGYKPMQTVLFIE
jgi:hypothetical protein